MTYLYNGVKTDLEYLKVMFEEGPYNIRMGIYGNDFNIFIQKCIIDGTITTIRDDNDQKE